MKRNILVGTLVLMASSLLAEDAKETVTGAAKKLAETDNYSWKQTIENAGGGGFGGGASEGKTQKGGYTWLTVTMRDNTIEALKKGEKGAIKGQDGWRSLEEASGGDRGPATFMARRIQNFKAPANQAEELAGKVKDLKEQDGVYSGDLTEEGAKSLMMFGGRGRGGGGGNGPE